MRKFVISLFCLAIICLSLIGGSGGGQAQTIPTTPGVYLPLISNVIPTATPTATLPPGGLAIKSSRVFPDPGSDEFTRIVGELENKTSLTVYIQNFHADFFDAAHNLIDSDDGYLSVVGEIFPGGIGAFGFRRSKEHGIVASYEASIIYDDDPNTIFRALTVLSKQVRNTSGVEVFGEILNDTDINIQYPVVTVIFYDAAGHILDTARSEPNPVVIVKGQKYAYSINTGYSFSYASFTVQAQGYLKE